MKDSAEAIEATQDTEEEDKRRSFGQIYDKNGKTFIRFPDPTAPRIPGKRPRSVVRHVPGGAKAAKKVLGEIHRAITAGTWSPVRPKPESPTVTLTMLGAVEEYLEAKKSDGTAPGTLHKYGTIRNRIAESDLGSRPVLELLPADVEAYLRWRQGRKYHALRKQGEKRTETMAVRVRQDTAPAPGTIRGDYALISAALNRLVLNDVLTRNPCAKVQKPKPR